mmetsp:Transcript_46926/g.101997  ORF Transcript_46926/g.101997 Transcript_46926/m.101997 type:complete len:82 (-) Transcript_46926:333-578(-)
MTPQMKVAPCSEASGAITSRQISGATVILRGLQLANFSRHGHAAGGPGPTSLMTVMTRVHGVRWPTEDQDDKVIVANVPAL